jgi:CelD/BcsL family acetyltransferase involved in cellulose biosynthesis
VGGPLVRSGEEAFFWPILLAGLDRLAMVMPLLSLKQVAQDDASLLALAAQCQQTQRPLRIVNFYDRAMRHIGSRGKLDERPLRHIRKDKARLRSLASRLEAECGPIMVHSLSSQDDVHRWADDFLQLEHSGWKGQAGSALSNAADTQAFFLATMAAAQERGVLRMQKLVVADRVLAMNVYFISAGHGYGFKMAYDEEYARFAPGQLLMDEVCDDVDGLPILWFDSCSGPDAQAINRRWPGRRRMVDVVVGMGKTPMYVTFHAIMTATALWHALKRCMWKIRALHAFQFLGAWRR